MSNTTMVPTHYQALENELYAAFEDVTEQATIPAPDTLSNVPTWPHLSASRECGIIWSELLVKESDPAESDCGRFLEGLFRDAGLETP